MIEIIVSLGMLLLTLLSALLWGRFLFFSFTVNFRSRAEKLLLNIGLGLGVISYLIFFLSLIGVLYNLTVFIILLIPFVGIWLRRGRICYNSKLSPSSEAESRHYNRVEIICLVLILALFLLNILASLTPPYAGDAIGYHLPPARDYLQAHKLVWLKGNVLSNQPAAAGMLFTIGFAAGGEYFPNLIHCLFGLLTACGIYFFGRRFSGRIGASLGALIFYLIPSVARISSWAYIDLGLTYWVILGLFTWFFWRLNGFRGALIISAVFFGLAMGSKYTGLVLFSVMAIMVGIECAGIKDRRDRIGMIFIWVGIAMIVASPWYLKNLFLTGNPCYPMLYSIFGGREWDAVRAADFRSIIMGGMRMNLIDYLILPWNLTVRAGYGYEAYDGIIGPVFLIFLPLLIFVKRKNYWIRFSGIYSVVYFFIWAFISLKIRKLTPVLPVISLITGVAIANVIKGRYSKFLKAMVLLVFGITVGINLQSVIAEAIKINPIIVISGKETRDEFLSRRIYNYRAVDYMNRCLPPGSGILFIYGGNAWYYSRHKTVVDSIFQDYTIKELLRRSGSPGELKELMLGRGITHILINIDIAEQGFISELSPAKNRILQRFFQKETSPIFREGQNFVLKINQ